VAERVRDEEGEPLLDGDVLEKLTVALELVRFDTWSLSASWKVREFLSEFASKFGLVQDALSEGYVEAEWMPAGAEELGADPFDVQFLRLKRGVLFVEIKERVHDDEEAEAVIDEYRRVLVRGLGRKAYLGGNHGKLFFYVESRPEDELTFHVPSAGPAWFGRDELLDIIEEWERRTGRRARV